VSHAEVGAVLGMRWHLGRDFLQVIRWHHEPRSVSISPECSELVMLCHTANYICNLERIGNGGDLPAPSFDQKVWSALGLTVSDISDIVDTIKEESKKSEILMSFI
jgi:HD-like signal output (HDOD) protein